MRQPNTRRPHHRTCLHFRGPLYSTINQNTRIKNSLGKIKQTPSEETQNPPAKTCQPNYSNKVPSLKRIKETWFFKSFFQANACLEKYPLYLV